MYMRKSNELVRMPGGHAKHPTKWMVKILSGPQRGMFALFDTLALARFEAIYQSDTCGVCTSIIAPVHGNE